MESSKTIIDLCSSDEESGAWIASHSDLSLLRNEPPRWNLLQALLKPRSADTENSYCSLSDAEDDKENAPPFSMMSSTARLMLPQLHSKPSESQFTEIQILPEVDPRFTRYKSLKHPSPFFFAWRLGEHNMWLRRKWDDEVLSEAWSDRNIHCLREL